jgi:hypothetical protein
MKAKPIKPKEMAAYLGISPPRLSCYADEIEMVKVYRFKRTPLGSLIFVEDDIEVLTDYMRVAAFFGRKKETMEMFRMTVGDKYRTVERPEWMRLMPNVIMR